MDKAGDPQPFAGEKDDINIIRHVQGFEQSTQCRSHLLNETLQISIRIGGDVLFKIRLG